MRSIQATKIKEENEEKLSSRETDQGMKTSLKIID